MARKKADGSAAKRLAVQAARKARRSKSAPKSDSKGRKSDASADQSQQAESQQSAATKPRGWRAAPFWCGLASSMMLTIAYPPFGLWPLALVAPAPLIWLSRKAAMTGPRPYLWIWLGSTVGWLALLQGVRLPHFVLYFGWLALSLYVAAYAPLFVAMTRASVHGARTPLIIAAPLVWVGLELVRGYAFTGFSVGLASHPLVAWPEMIQLAEFGGAYLVSLIVLIVAASIARAAPCDAKPGSSWPLIPLTIALGATWLFGVYQLKQFPTRSMKDGVPVCLLQSNQNVIFVADSDRNVAIYEQCLDKAIEAKRDHPELRLIIWPESTSSANRVEVLFDGESLQPPAGVTQAKYEELARWNHDAFEEHKVRTAKLVDEAARPFGFYDEGDSPRGNGETEEANGEEGNKAVPTFQLLGAASERVGEHAPERLNTALLIDSQGRSMSRYHKVHRVMFGEYVPLGDQIPLIYSLTPMGRGLTPGSEPMAFEVDGVRFSPNICFEVTVPHLVRSQFNRLAKDGQAPDVIVNVSNDGWFWGSSILDLHFACNVFRAVELRRTVVSSANTGVTAWVDDGGRVLRRAPKQTIGAELGGAYPARRGSTFYARFGDLIALLCLAASVLATGVGWRKARRT